MAVVDEPFLSAFPNLKAIFYGSGSVRSFVTDPMWRRGVVVSSAYAANAIPVAEFTGIAQIIMASKHAWRFERAARRDRRQPQAGMIHQECTAPLSASYPLV